MDPEELEIILDEKTIELEDLEVQVLELEDKIGELEVNLDFFAFPHRLARYRGDRT